jgi:hypothetical protein
VDFRAAPPPGVDTRSLEAAAAVADALGQASGSGATPGAGSSAAEAMIQAVMKPSPGGNIVYFRVD